MRSLRSVCHLASSTATICTCWLAFMASRKPATRRGPTPSCREPVTRATLPPSRPPSFSPFNTDFTGNAAEFDMIFAHEAEVEILGAVARRRVDEDDRYAGLFGADQRGNDRLLQKPAIM